MKFLRWLRRVLVALLFTPKATLGALCRVRERAWHRDRGGWLDVVADHTGRARFVTLFPYPTCGELVRPLEQLPNGLVLAEKVNAATGELGCRFLMPPHLMSLLAPLDEATWRLEVAAHVAAEQATQERLAEISAATKEVRP